MSAADRSLTTPDTLDSAALEQQLEAALRATLFGSRLTITPRRIAQIAAACAASFQSYLSSQEDEAAVRAFGQRMVQEGLGHSSLLAMVGALQIAALAQGLQPAATRYTLPLLAGYMAAREAYLLAEQERTRQALERARRNNRD